VVNGYHKNLGKKNRPQNIAIHRKRGYEISQEKSRLEIKHKGEEISLTEKIHQAGRFAKTKGSKQSKCMGYLSSRGGTEKRV